MPASASFSSTSTSSAVAPGRNGIAISTVRVCPLVVNVTDWRNQMCSPSFSPCRTNALLYPLPRVASFSRLAFPPLYSTNEW